MPAEPYTPITTFNLEGLVLGINCVLYGFCVYILWNQRSVSCRVLLVINTVEFLLSMLKAIFHTVFFFRVFVVHGGNILQYLQHVNTFILWCAIVFNIAFIASASLSIWRLYVLYGNDIKICIPALVLLIAQICASGISIRVYVATPVSLTGFDPFHMLLWTVITTLNLYVAILICLRLYIAQKRTRIVLSPSRWKSIAIALVECCALVTACSVGMMILYACSFTKALHSQGIATELAIASQLLITARHGMSSQSRPTTSVSGPSTIRFESRLPDRPTEAGKPRVLGPPVEATSRDQKDRSDMA